MICPLSRGGGGGIKALVDCPLKKVISFMVVPLRGRGVKGRAIKGKKKKFQTAIKLER